MLSTRLLSLFLSVVLFLYAGPLCGGHSVKQAGEIAKNEFAAAGYALTRQILAESYDPVQHELREYMGSGGAPHVWPVASLTENLADACRLFPNSASLKAAYRDMLTNILGKYLVKNAVIGTPEAEYEGVSYYSAAVDGTGDYYYDDNAWVCIQLLLGSRQLRDARLLDAALENLAFLWTGWDDALGGGIYWHKTWKSKNTCSNAPVAAAFLLAYQITGKELALARGKAI